LDITGIRLYQTRANSAKLCLRDSTNAMCHFDTVAINQQSGSPVSSSAAPPTSAPRSAFPSSFRRLRTSTCTWRKYRCRPPRKGAYAPAPGVVRVDVFWFGCRLQWRAACRVKLRALYPLDLQGESNETLSISISSTLFRDPVSLTRHSGKCLLW
jgi:hypothetical protein